jgi:hypothetical protein
MDLKHLPPAGPQSQFAPLQGLMRIRPMLPVMKSRVGAQISYTDPHSILDALIIFGVHHEICRAIDCIMHDSGNRHGSGSGLPVGRQFLGTARLLRHGDAANGATSRRAEAGDDRSTGACGRRSRGREQQAGRPDQRHLPRLLSRCASVLIDKSVTFLPTFRSGGGNGEGTSCRDRTR